MGCTRPPIPAPSDPRARAPVPAASRGRSGPGPVIGFVFVSALTPQAAAQETAGRAAPRAPTRRSRGPAVRPCESAPDPAGRARPGRTRGQHCRPAAAPRLGLGLLLCPSDLRLPLLLPRLGAAHFRESPILPCSQLPAELASGLRTRPDCPVRGRRGALGVRVSYGESCGGPGVAEALDGAGLERGPRAGGGGGRVWRATFPSAPPPNTKRRMGMPCSLSLACEPVPPGLRFRSDSQNLRGRKGGGQGRGLASQGTGRE